MSTSRASRSLPPFKKRWCSYSGASSEKVKKARLSAVAYLNQRQSGQDQSHGAASSAEQPVAANVTTAEGASSSADSSSGHGQAAAAGGQQFRKGAVIERPRQVVGYGLPSACEAAETSKGVSSAAQPTDAGHLSYHIVFRTDGNARDVAADVPDAYQWYNEETAEDAVEAALACGSSTWNTPGQVPPRGDQRDDVGLAADHLLQLIAKTKDCINRCWPEGTPRNDVQRVANSFMDTHVVLQELSTRRCSSWLGRSGLRHEYAHSLSRSLLSLSLSLSLSLLSLSLSLSLFNALCGTARLIVTFKGIAPRAKVFNSPP